MVPTPLEPALPAISTTDGEREMLRQFLDFYRAVLARKAHGLSAQQLNTAIVPSDLTIGGLILHMTGVEEGWFSQWFLDQPIGPPWDAIDWDADPDWELHNVDAFAPDEMLTMFNNSCERSRQIEAAARSLDEIAARTGDDGRRYSLRWIMIHMVEEYARHCGHADFIRQALDGTVGE